MSLSRREPSPQCARTAARIASATPGAVSAAPLGYDPYSTRRSTRSGNAAANAMAVQLPDEPPMSDTRSSSSSSRSARSVATSPSRSDPNLAPCGPTCRRRAGRSGSVCSHPRLPSQNRRKPALCQSSSRWLTHHAGATSGGPSPRISYATRRAPRGRNRISDFSSIATSLRRPPEQPTRKWTTDPPAPEKPKRRKEPCLTRIRNHCNYSAAELRMTPSAVMWVARAGIEPATFRFSGGSPPAQVPFALVSVLRADPFGPSGAAGLKVWPDFGRMEFRRRGYLRVMSQPAPVSHHLADLKPAGHDQSPVSNQRPRPARGPQVQPLVQVGVCTSMSMPPSPSTM